LVFQTCRMALKLLDISLRLVHLFFSKQRLGAPPFCPQKRRKALSNLPCLRRTSLFVQQPGPRLSNATFLRRPRFGTPGADVYAPPNVQSAGGFLQSGDGDGKTRRQVPHTLNPQCFTGPNSGFRRLHDYRLLPTVDQATIVRDIATRSIGFHDHIANLAAIQPSPHHGPLRGAQLAAITDHHDR